MTIIRDAVTSAQDLDRAVEEASRARWYVPPAQTNFLGTNLVFTGRPDRIYPMLEVGRMYKLVFDGNAVIVPETGYVIPYQSLESFFKNWAVAPYSRTDPADAWAVEEVR